MASRQNPQAQAVLHAWPHRVEASQASSLPLSAFPGELGFTVCDLAGLAFFPCLVQAALAFLRSCAAIVAACSCASWALLQWSWFSRSAFSKPRTGLHWPLALACSMSRAISARLLSHMVCTGGVGCARTAWEARGGCSNGGQGSEGAHGPCPHELPPAHGSAIACCYPSAHTGTQARLDLPASPRSSSGLSTYSGLSTRR